MHISLNMRHIRLCATVRVCSVTVEAPKDVAIWRVGKRVPRNLYRDGVDVGRMDSPELAQAVVDALNVRDIASGAASEPEPVIPGVAGQWAVPGGWKSETIIGLDVPKADVPKAAPGGRVVSTAKDVAASRLWESTGKKGGPIEPECLEDHDAMGVPCPKREAADLDKEAERLYSLYERAQGFDGVCFGEEGAECARAGWRAVAEETVAQGRRISELSAANLTIVADLAETRAELNERTLERNATRKEVQRIRDDRQMFVESNVSLSAQISTLESRYKATCEAHDDVVREKDAQMESERTKFECELVENGRRHHREVDKLEGDRDGFKSAWLRADEENKRLRAPWSEAQMRDAMFVVQHYSMSGKLTVGSSIDTFVRAIEAAIRGAKP